MASSFEASTKTSYSTVRKRPRRFAPLDPSKSGGDGGGDGMTVPTLRGIVFDVDGTLCLPQNYMFREMRAALSIPKSTDILDHIRSLSNVLDEPSDTGASQPPPHSTVNSTDPPSEETLSNTPSIPDPPPTSPQSRAVAKIQAIERTAMTSQRPQPGLQEVMAYLTKRGVRKALCTRNFPAPVHHLLNKYLDGEVFEPIITRETEGVEPKPSPEGLWVIAKAWGLDRDVEADSESIKGGEGKPEEEKEMDPLVRAREFLGSGLIMVGDSIDDMAAGHRAGAATVLLVNDENEALAEHEYTDLGVRRLDDLIEVLEKGFEGRS